jgi:predicted molibdopterin-dependent oxidoreductase YjgC
VNQAIELIGQARPDWQIISDLGKRLSPGWNYASTAEIMGEIAALTPIYAGITHERLEQGERLHWPVASRAHEGTPILPVGLFSCGEAHWLATEL